MPIIFITSLRSAMFQNSYGPDGSININVVPSFGHIVMLPEQQKVLTVHVYIIIVVRGG